METLKEKFDNDFDVWTFLEVYMTDYTQSDYVAWIDDIDCVLHGEKTTEEVTWLDGATREEMLAEQNRMMRIILEDAFRNYINENYPE